MTTSSRLNQKFRLLTVLLPPCAFAGLLFWMALVRVNAQKSAGGPRKKSRDECRRGQTRKHQRTSRCPDAACRSTAGQ